MPPPATRASAEIIALYERAAAALSASASLADGEVRRAASHSNSRRAAIGQSRAERSRHAADQGRRSGRRLHLRAQAGTLFGHVLRWRPLFDGDDTVDGPRLPALEAAVIGTDLDGTVRLWNAAAERLYGWSRPDVVGRPITDLTVGPADAEVAERIMASVRSIGSWEGEFWVTRRDGSRFLAYVRNVAVLDDDGRAFGLVGISIDLAPGFTHPGAGRPSRTAPS